MITITAQAHFGIAAFFMQCDNCWLPLNFVCNGKVTKMLKNKEVIILVMLENPAVMFGLIGALGGFLRAIVGVRKAQLQKRKFVLKYFLITVIGAGVIGAILGSVIGINRSVALFAGYAGTDLLEGLAKSFKIAPIRIG